MSFLNSWLNKVVSTDFLRKKNTIPVVNSWSFVNDNWRSGIFAILNWLMTDLGQYMTPSISLLWKFSSISNGGELSSTYLKTERVKRRNFLFRNWSNFRIKIIYRSSRIKCLIDKYISGTVMILQFAASTFSIVSYGEDCRLPCK